MSWWEALYERSYANLILLSATLPSYQPEKDKPKGEEVIDASLPENQARISEILSAID